MCSISLFVYTGCGFFEDGNSISGSNTSYYTSSSRVPVSSISISQRDVNLSIDKTCTLTATVLPSNATNKRVNWESTNTNIATVNNNGVVTAKGIGSTYIKVISAENSSIYNYYIVSVGGDYEVTFNDKFPYTYHKDVMSNGVCLGTKSLRVNSVSYSTKTYSTFIAINLTILCVRTNASGYFSSDFTLKYRVFDEQGILKENGGIYISSNVDEIIEKRETIHVSYDVVPKSAKFNISFS